MKNFQPGGLRNRHEYVGGRPKADTDAYAPKNRKSNFKTAYNKSSAKKSGGYNPKDRAPRETKSYPAVCSECKRPCDVPFRPDGVKPVFCRDCFAKKNDATTNMTGHPERFTANERVGHRTEANYSSGKPTTEVSVANYNLLVQQLGVLENKVNQILELLKASEKLVVELPTLTTESEDTETTVKENKTAKKAAAKKSTAKPKKVASKMTPKT